MILYVGPDQLIPLGSFAGSVVGLVLLFWNKLVALFSRITRRPLVKPAPVQPPTQANASATFDTRGDRQS